MSIALATVIAAVAAPAIAQVVSCPPGYGYSYGYGCVPAGPVYAAPVVNYPPPVYDTFGLAFGFDHGHHGDWHHDGGHGGGHDDHHH
jgi:hypothetical protein